jgi:hypothetical protein
MIQSTSTKLSDFSFYDELTHHARVLLLTQDPQKKSAMVKELNSNFQVLKDVEDLRIATISSRDGFVAL